MKNFFVYSFFLLIILIFLGWMPFALNAASVSLLPEVKSVHKGETFIINVLVDPLGENVFTVKAVFSYPPELLKVTAFTFSEGWLPLSQLGYTEIRNDKGTMIKTAGYPSGISSRKNLGTISFLGLKEGNAKIEISSDSLVLNSESKNILTIKNPSVLNILPAKVISQNKIIVPKKEEKPITKNDEGQIIPDSFSKVDINIPSDVPSPEKAWLYTKLAALSILALVLRYKIIIYILIAILIYIMFKIARRILKKV